MGIVSVSYAFSDVDHQSTLAPKKLQRDPCHIQTPKLPSKHTPIPLKQNTPSPQPPRKTQ